METAVFWVLGLAAFGLASLAAQSWRELAVLLVLSLVLYWPAKWLTAGTFLGGDALTSRPGGGIGISANASFAIGIAAAAVIMIVARHIRLGRAEKAGKGES